MKRGLEHLQHQIDQWRSVVERFPDRAGYQTILAKLQQERAELAALIGRKKDKRKP